MNFISSITLQFRDAFSSGFTSAQNSFAGMKGALGEINQNQDMNRLAADLAMATGLTEPFRRGLSSMLDMPGQLAGGFETSMKNIQAITGATGAEMDALSGELLAVGGKSAAGPQAVADAFNDVAGGIAIVSPGVKLLDVQMQVLNNSLALAEAGQADLGTAAEGLTKIMNSYRFTMGGVEEVNERAAWASDVMTQAVGMGMGSMQEFISAMAPLSGAAASVGVGFDEIGSTLAYMTSTTDTAATAGTKLEAFMIALQKPGKDLTAALEGMGYSSGTVMLAELGLAESARVVSAAFGGNQDAITQAMGRAEAMKAVISLTGDAYVDFAQQFGSTMNGITEAAKSVQVESYESKVARLQAATDSLQIQIGGDINAIKGFFVDMGSVFLNNVAAPIMSSPVGEVFQGIAAGVGLAAKGVLDLGSGALNTASQLVMLTATLQNSGGFAKLFGNALGGIASPLRKIGTSIVGMIGPLIAKTTATFAATAAEVGFAGAMWATAGAVWAATWPILAVVAAVAALALGGYMLVKHWDAVSGFFVNLWNKITGAFSAAFDWIRTKLAGVSDWVLVAVAVFMPFIGIPALIIKHWDTLSAFFVGLWTRITGWIVSAWEGIKEFFTSLWNNIVSTFTGVWNAVPGFFSSLWNSIVSIVATVANWFTGVWQTVTGAFSAAWTWASNLFTSILNGITGIVAGAANWFGETFGFIANSFAAAWTWVSNLFTSIWEGIKGVVTGFVEWLSPVIDAIIKPFKDIGNVIGGIIGSVKGWFGETVEMGKTELAVMNENKMAAAAAKPVQTNQPAPATQTAASSYTASAINASGPETASPITTPALTATGEVAVPSLIAPVASIAPVAPSVSAGTMTAGADTALIEHLAAASRKGIAGSETSAAASNAFMASPDTITATVTPGVDMGGLNRQTQTTPFLESLAMANMTVTPALDTTDFENSATANFQEAVRPRQAAVETPWREPEGQQKKESSRVFHIENVNLNADDIYHLLDFARQLEQAIHEPVEALV
jgi:TP901 family phage tail tape measure protein